MGFSSPRERRKQWAKQSPSPGNWVHRDIFPGRVDEKHRWRCTVSAGSVEGGRQSQSRKWVGEEDVEKRRDELLKN